MKNKLKQFVQYYENGVLLCDIVSKMQEFHALHKQSKFTAMQFFMYCHQNKVLDLSGGSLEFGSFRFGMGSKSGQIRLNERSSVSNLDRIMDYHSNAHESIVFIREAKELYYNNSYLTVCSGSFPFTPLGTEIFESPEEVYFQSTTLVPEEYINLYAFYSSVYNNLKVPCTVEVNNFSKSFLNARLKKVNAAIEKVQELLSTGVL